MGCFDDKQEPERDLPNGNISDINMNNYNCILYCLKNNYDISATQYRYEFF